MKFEIQPSNGPQPYHVRIVASNGRILFSSENYYNKADAQHVIDIVKAGAASAMVVDMTSPVRGYGR